jgi:Xaa-Pro dipeptidase
MSQPNYPARQARLLQALPEAKLEALALNPGPTLTYLTGLHFHLMERPVVALFAPGQAPSLVLPILEMAKLEGLPYPLQAFSYGDNPATWAAAFTQALGGAQLNGRQVGVEPRSLRVLELRFLENAAPQAHFISGEAPLAALRIQKEPAEVAAMRQAVLIAQKALQATLPAIRPGVTERAIASDLTLQLLRHGSAPEMAFSPIVSGGPNGANPHATPSDRPLARGDLLVIDWGATYDGYISDLTRTFAIGPVEPELEHIHKIVQEANAAGRAAAKPGRPIGEIDQAARQVIVQAGYGEYFTHRTGHGIGMEGHEEPYVFGENPLLLAPGMAFTVEPGIYLPGRNGVRIEDNLVITPDGAECLSDYPRHLITLEG